MNRSTGHEPFLSQLAKSYELQDAEESPGIDRKCRRPVIIGKKSAVDASLVIRSASAPGHANLLLEPSYNVIDDGEIFQNKV